MTARQLERRQRVIAAVQELVRGGGGSGTCRSRRSPSGPGVSLAAIYRYFSSKEHLLAEALLDWAQRLHDPGGCRRLGPAGFAATRPPRGRRPTGAPRLRRAVPRGGRLAGPARGGLLRAHERRVSTGAMYEAVGGRRPGAGRRDRDDRRQRVAGRPVRAASTAAPTSPISNAAWRPRAACSRPVPA